MMMMMMMIVMMMIVRMMIVRMMIVRMMEEEEDIYDCNDDYDALK